MSFTIIYITHPDEVTASQISNELLDAKLIACANIFPMSSMYFWKGEIQKEGEFISIVKTHKRKLAEILSMVENIHPYGVPCILHFKVKANKAYENWIKESVGCL